MVDLRDVISHSELEGDFFIVHTLSGYHLGVRDESEAIIILNIDKECYNRLEKVSKQTYGE